MYRSALAAAALVLLAAGCSQGGDEVQVNVTNERHPAGQHRVRRHVRFGARR